MASFGKTGTRADGTYDQDAADEDWEQFKSDQKPVDALVERLMGKGLTKAQVRSAVQLRWQNKQLRDSDCIYIAQMLREMSSYTANPNVALFSLDHNMIGDEGLIQIADTLKIPNGLAANTTGFWLNNNQIGDAGTVALAKALKEGAMPKLQKIYLHDNCIADEGAFAIADAIRNCSQVLDRLRFIYLANNNISQDGMNAVASAAAKLGRIAVVFDDGDRAPSPSPC